MLYSATMPQRRAIRLPGYDDTQAGAHFVTLCTQNWEPVFGDIQAGVMHLNACGKMAAATWQWLGTQYPYIALDEWVMMPNHFHGIVIMSGGHQYPESVSVHSLAKKPLGRLIGAFKTVSTKRINLIRQKPGVLWQRNYYEHIIRDEQGLAAVREYIRANPLH